MATYRELHGRSIQAVTTDPTGDVSEGQIWYNTTSDTFKTTLVSEAWASSAPMISAKRAAMPGGIQTAAFTAGGNDGSTNVNSTFEYNGSGFSSGGNINTTRRGGGGAGTLTAGLIIGGYTTTIVGSTEEYDGTSWTSANSMGTGRSGAGTNGLQTASFAFCGYNGTAQTNLVEEYDGTNWSTGNTCPTSAGERAADGVQTAAIVFGGTTSTDPGGQTANAELYDGTNWTSASALNTARERLGGFGPQSSAYAFGGSAPPTTAKTENYNGTSWSETSDMATARDNIQSGQTGSSTAGVAMGSNTAPGAVTDATEEFTRSVNVITAATFSSGGSLNTARWGLGGCGTQTAGIVFGGRNPPVGQDLALSEEYNGTSWSEGPDLGQATRVCGKGTGTQTAALKHGGHYGSPSTRYKVAEEYDGSSWTNGGTSTNAHDGTMQIGTQTAAASCGGYDGAPMNETEEYNGTSFSTANAMTYSGYSGGASGPQTAAVVFGGGYPAVFSSSEYDGTNWTAGGTLAPKQGGYGTCGNTGNGSQTAAIGAGGYAPGPSFLSNSFTYDGTVFSTGPNISTGRNELASGGPNSNFFVAGGLISTGSASNLTEEFTEETTAVNVKTLTQS